MKLTELKTLAAEANTTTLHYYVFIHNYLNTRKTNNLQDNEITLKYKDFDINNLLYDIECYDDIKQINKDIVIELTKFKEGYNLNLDFIDDAMKIEYYLNDDIKNEILHEIKYNPISFFFLDEEYKLNQDCYKVLLKSSRIYLFKKSIEEDRRIELAHEILRIDKKAYRKQKILVNPLTKLQKEIKKHY